MKFAFSSLISTGNIDFTKSLYFNKSSTLRIQMQGDKFFSEENYNCKFFYEILVNKKFKYPLHQTFLERNFGLQRKISWKSIYIQKITNILDKSVAEFNYKLLHHLLSNRYLVSKWNRDIDNKCILCNNEIENNICICSMIVETYSKYGNLLVLVLSLILVGNILLLAFMMRLTTRLFCWIIWFHTLLAEYTNLKCVVELKVIMRVAKIWRLISRQLYPTITKLCWKLIPTYTLLCSKSIWCTLIYIVITFNLK